MIKDVSEAIEKESKEQKDVFISIALDTLGASLSGNLLTSKWVKRSKILGRGVMQAGKGKGQDF